MQKKRRIFTINLGFEGPCTMDSFDYGGVHFNIIRHNIGYDLDHAESLIKKLDGFADAIVLSGIPDSFSDQGKTSPYIPMHKLKNLVHKSKVYNFWYLLNFFTNWTLRRWQTKDPHALSGRSVLFTTSGSIPGWSYYENMGANVIPGDGILLPCHRLAAKFPETSAKSAKVLQKILPPKMINPRKILQHPKVVSIIREKILSQSVL